jgi:uncharacterized membrane protein YesL
MVTLLPLTDIDFTIDCQIFGKLHNCVSGWVGVCVLDLLTIEFPAFLLFFAALVISDYI